MIKQPGASGPSILQVDGVNDSNDSNPSSLVYTRTFTVIEDGLGIFGTATTQGEVLDKAKYMPIANGTYNVTLTAINGVATHGVANFTLTHRLAAAGFIGGASLNVVDQPAVASLDLTAKRNNFNDATYTNSPTLPYSFGQVNYDSSTNSKGVWARFQAPEGNPVATPSWVLLFEPISTSTGGRSVITNIDEVSLYATHTNLTQGGDYMDSELSNDGINFFTSDNQSVYRYTLATAFDISTASASGSLSLISTSARGFRFNTSGNRLFGINNSDRLVRQSRFKEAYNFTPISGTELTFDVSSKESAPLGINFNKTGTKMYVVGEGSDSINEYGLSTAYQIDTATWLRSKSVSAQTGNPTKVAFTNNGSTMFVSGEFSSIFQYTLSTPYDVSTASYTGRSLAIANLNGMAISQDETILTVTRIGTKHILEYRVA
jgi:hypothetical protein